MRCFISLLFLCFFSIPSLAQEYLDQPICFKLVNNAPYGVYGDVKTAPDTYKGEQPNITSRKISHTATFRLKEGENMPVCTTGPLFAGNKVLITLRTLVPIFECKSAIYHGAEIKIQGSRKKDGFGTETWVECL